MNYLIIIPVCSFSQLTGFLSLPCILAHGFTHRLEVNQITRLSFGTDFVQSSAELFSRAIILTESKSALLNVIVEAIKLIILVSKLRLGWTRPSFPTCSDFLVEDMRLVLASYV